MEREKISIGKISINSPVILGFTFLCFLAMIIDQLSRGMANQFLFSVYRSSLTDPLAYIRIFLHVIGHSGWDHFSGNITLILLIGPLLEEKYGALNLVLVMILTALLTGIINILIFPNVALIGASGIVYALIVLSSFTGEKDRIPLTFILVFVIYIGAQVYDGIFIQDNISNLTHIVGGLIGGGFGFLFNKKMN
ncbi:GlpG protein [Acetitomaculum ruminis DSM 5522]|uniref:GlpG protein n=1 Tax=Acetitomaculum ruminis DSM 5522 TaxID=1120918 RepID=A0A1I0YD52_9FIRM|nr:rhomboid family intramembrane serine protease [Acetitomaculum ruminis]SFB10706.1 GlpG protein [Acetitomaculum ruminis DSM 5522]